MSKEERGVDYFWRDHPLARIQAKMSLQARRRIFAIVRKFLSAGDTVLDVGATPDLKRVDSNCFPRFFIEDGHSITMSSIEDISSLRDEFPGVELLSGKNLKEIVDSGRTWDWVFSSAVLEHVGSEKSQADFIRECYGLCRKGAIFTTPNRGHWLEFHTKLPFLHWLPKVVHRSILRVLGLKFWAQEKNLNLLKNSDLLRLSSGIGALVENSEVSSLGMKSNLILILRKTSHE
jgi:hypothetical protein